MSIIALRLKEKSVDQLIPFALEFQSNLTANAAVFATPPVALSDFQSNIDALQTAQQSTIMGGVPETVVRNEKLKLVLDNIKQLARYVELVSNGNLETIMLAKLPLRRRGPQRYENLETPQIVSADSLYSETASLRWKKISNAKAYEVEYCQDPITADGWKKAPIISAARTVVNGLIRKEEYWFRVRALGSQGIVSNWSSPAKQLVS
jgi:hypothetical protein